MNPEQIVSKLKELKKQICADCPHFEELDALDNAIKIFQSNGRRASPEITPCLRSHDHQPQAGPQERKCLDCGEVKDLKDFARKSKGSKEPGDICRACKRQDYQVEYRKKHKRADSVNPVNEKDVPPGIEYEKGLFTCPVKGCDATLTSKGAYEQHYVLRHL